MIEYIFRHEFFLKDLNSYVRFLTSQFMRRNEKEKDEHLHPHTGKHPFSVSLAAG
jgi:hypothetical protein